jgi:hypothetical protein
MNDILEYVYAAAFMGFIIGTFALITIVWGSWLVKSYTKQKSRKHLKLVHSVSKSELIPTDRTGKVRLLKSS